MPNYRIYLRCVPTDYLFAVLKDNNFSLFSKEQLLHDYGPIFHLNQLYKCIIQSILKVKDLKQKYFTVKETPFRKKYLANNPSKRALFEQIIEDHNKAKLPKDYCSKIKTNPSVASSGTITLSSSPYRSPALSRSCSPAMSRRNSNKSSPAMSRRNSNKSSPAMSSKSNSPFGSGANTPRNPNISQPVDKNLLSAALKKLIKKTPTKKTKTLNKRSKTPTKKTLNKKSPTPKRSYNKRLKLLPYLNELPEKLPEMGQNVSTMVLKSKSNNLNLPKGICKNIRQQCRYKDPRTKRYTYFEDDGSENTPYHLELSY